MKGILFRPELIKAIRDGRKTVTRRTGGLKEINKEPGAWIIESTNTSWWLAYHESGEVISIKPRYLPGEIVYVKEAWQSLGNKENTVYKMDGESKLVWDIGGKHGEEVVKKWRSPLFMPAWAARTFLRIVNVGLGRLQEISWVDCLAEGVQDKGNDNFYLPETPRVMYSVPQGAYAQLWDSIEKEYPWAINPWLGRIEFERTERPE